MQLLLLLTARMMSLQQQQLIPRMLRLLLLPVSRPLRLL